MESIRITTERLILEPLGLKYLESTHVYAADPENTRLMVYLPNQNIEETTAFLSYVDEEWTKENPLTYEFAILLEGEHIGAIGLSFEEDRKKAELGWIINKRYWKKGYAGEAAKALTDYAINKLGIEHFIAHCDSENTGSYKVMEKLGMKLTGKSYGRKNKSSEEDREELVYEKVIGKCSEE